MSDRPKHLIFYDGNCGLCDHVVQIVFKADKKEIFAFAPLQGKTASKYLVNLPPEMRFTDSLILIENWRTSDSRLYVLASGALRIAWLLGWPWVLVGILSFLPGWLFNWAYRLVAANRHRFFSQDVCFVPPSDHAERFLP